MAAGKKLSVFEAAPDDEGFLPFFLCIVTSPLAPRKLLFIPILIARAVRLQISCDALEGLLNPSGL